MKGDFNDTIQIHISLVHDRQDFMQYQCSIQGENYEAYSQNSRWKSDLEGCFFKGVLEMIKRNSIEIKVDIKAKKNNELIKWARRQTDFIRFKKQGTLGNLDLIEEIENE